MWNIPLKTKNPQKSKFADFFIFQKNLKKTQKLAIFLFLARGRQCEVNNRLLMGLKNV